MKPFCLKAVLGSFVLSQLLVCSGQFQKSNYEFGLGAGFSIYQGDLTPHKLGSVETAKPALDIYVNRVLNYSLSLRTSFTLSRLRGDESIYANPDYRRQRNFNFTTPLKELDEMLVWNHDSRRRIDAKFSTYFMAGMGLALLHIKRDWSRINYNYFGAHSPVLDGLSQDSLQRLRRVLPVIPVGAGLRYQIRPTLFLTVESVLRFTFYDYLDGFSKAADPSRRDYYYITTIGIVYRPGYKNRLNCPKL